MSDYLFIYTLKLPFRHIMGVFFFWHVAYFFLYMKELFIYYIHFTATRMIFHSLDSKNLFPYSQPFSAKIQVIVEFNFHAPYSSCFFFRLISQISLDSRPPSLFNSHPPSLFNCSKWNLNYISSLECTPLIDIFIIHYVRAEIFVAWCARLLMLGKGGKGVL